MANKNVPAEANIHHLEHGRAFPAWRRTYTRLYGTYLYAKSNIRWECWRAKMPENWHGKYLTTTNEDRIDSPSPSLPSFLSYLMLLHFLLYLKSGIYININISLLFFAVCFRFPFCCCRWRSIIIDPAGSVCLDFMAKFSTLFDRPLDILWRVVGLYFFLRRLDSFSDPLTYSFIRIARTFFSPFYLTIQRDCNRNPRNGGGGSVIWDLLCLAMPPSFFSTRKKAEKKRRIKFKKK
jgi:hypothetical protein